MEGRTSFVIAHRLSTIRDADQVLVIDHGRDRRARHARRAAGPTRLLPPPLHEPVQGARAVARFRLSSARGPTSLRLHVRARDARRRRARGRAERRHQSSDRAAALRRRTRPARGQALSRGVHEVRGEPAARPGRRHAPQSRGLSRARRQDLDGVVGVPRRARSGREGRAQGPRGHRARAHRRPRAEADARRRARARGRRRARPRDQPRQVEASPLRVEHAHPRRPAASTASASRRPVQSRGAPR